MDFILIFFSLFSCMVSYFNFDPLKSSFFLVFSMIFLMPLVTFFSYVWFSYFICMLFLSGVFVILVYFSSLSSLIVFKPYFYFLVFLLAFFLYYYVVKLELVGNSVLGLSVFYYEVNLYLMMLLIVILLFFMSFVSYFLGFSGALRSV